MPKQTAVFVPYTDDYKAKCFVVWYTAGRPHHLTDLEKVLPKDEHGRVPGVRMLGEWRRENEWDIRADEMDARAMAQVSDELVAQKVKMLKRQAEIGEMLQDKGKAYLEKEDGLDSSSAAITAIVKGVEIERSSRGLSELLAKLSKMSESDIKAQILRLSARADNESILDAEEISAEKE